MSEPEFITGPRRAHSLIGKVEGDTREDLAHNLEHLAYLIRTDQLQGPSLSGSPSGNHIVDYYRDEKMTHDRYFAEINAWLEERRRADAAGHAPIHCLDCGIHYSSFPLDTTLPNEQWAIIHDSEGGILCANCIVRRAARVPGAVAVRAHIEIVETCCPGNNHTLEGKCRAL